jgi:predicted component of type VI protein secretion system
MAITLELTPEIEARLMAQATAQGITVEEFLQAAILLKGVASAIANLLNTEPLVYRVGTALVVQSTPIGNLETAVEQMREERISSLIADYESPI